MTPDELAARLKAHPFADVREPLMHKITLLALGRSLRHTPVRFGHLRRANTSRVERGGLRGFLENNLVYAPFQHARIPFFELGIQDSRAQIAQLLEQAGDEYFEGLV